MVRHNKKFRDIVDTARRLFWKHGLRRVTVEEICQEANVSKMTFYKYFPNKTELGKEILNSMFEENMKVFDQLMLSDIPFEEKMHRQIKMKLEGTQDISEEFIKDIYGDPESELCMYWKKQSNKVIERVLAHYRNAQEKGWLRKDVKIDFILYMINKSFEMVNDQSLIAHYDTMQDLILEINRFFLYGILPYEKQTDE
jgi:AcrR family transcriptional regulator